MCQSSTFDIMSSPERFVSESGNPEAKSKIDRFYEEVLGELGFDPEARATFCQVRSREIATEASTDASPHLSVDRITELLAMDITVAMALEVRDDFNYTQFYLASFLTPELIEEICSSPMLKRE